MTVLPQLPEPVSLPLRGRALLRALLIGASIGGAAAIAPMACAQSAIDARSEWNIPAGPLDAALARFAADSGANLAFEPQLVAGRHSGGVSGSYTATEALDRLLAGSGVTAERSGSGVFRLQRAPASDAVTLPKMKITAAGDSSLPNRQETGYRSRHSAVSGFREQAALDTPFSVATVSAELIDDQQAKSLIDVLRNDPSVTPASNPLWYDRVHVRGFVLSVDAIHRDGLSINDQGSIALENKAAVEINKGLSAMRYGATSPGGTINYAVKRPTQETLRKITLSGDEFGSIGLHADVGGRIGATKQFGYRINAAGEEQRSHIDAFEGDKEFISGFFDWKFNDRLLLEVDVEHQRLDKLNVESPSLFWWASIAEARAAFRRLKPDTYAYQGWAEEPNEQTYIATRVNYDLSENWKATVAMQHAELWRDQDAGGVFSTVAENGDYEASIYYSPDQERNNRAYQLVLQGDVHTGDVLHELAFGYDRLRRDMTYGAGVYTEIGTDNIFNPRGVARPSVSAADAGDSYLANRVRQDSWFITDNLVLNDEWRVFGGLRRTQIRQYGADSVSAPLENPYDRFAITPTAGVVFKPVPEGTLYLSYAEGIEQGAVVPNDPTYTNDGEVLEPLESEQYEAGVKWETGNDVLLTAALFEIDKGLEIERNNGDATRTLVQNGRQVHRGLEVTISGAATEQLRLMAGLAYLDAEIEKTDDETLVGKSVQGVPEWQANLYADYSLDRYVAGLSLTGGLFYVDEKPIDAPNTWMADSFVRIDIGARYLQTLSSHQAITYRLIVDNAADEEYLANTTGGTLEFGEPRTVKASMTYEF